LLYWTIPSEHRDRQECRENGMLSVADANLLIDHHLGDTPRAAHSRFVGLLADLLKAADAIALVDQRLGRRWLCDIDQTDPYTMLRRQIGDRPYLCDMLQRYTDKHTLSFVRNVEIMASASLQ
jgi:hypothetical protein